MLMHLRPILASYDGGIPDLKRDVAMSSEGAILVRFKEFIC